MPAQMKTVQNFLVPADGRVGTYLWRETLVPGVAQVINFKELNLDGQEFWPYGVYMDNTAGTATLWITIDQMFLNIGCPAGQDKRTMYPGPTDQTVTVTGNGLVTLLFVNFPIV